MVNLALIEQVHIGPCPTKCENCLAFYHQLEETWACYAANTECKEAYQKSLTIYFAVLFADCLMPAASISATSIAPKLILINFKKIQGKDCVKIF
jgi:hypothetical protein